MMQVANYRLHRRARTAFQQLDTDEQVQVRERLLSLGETPVTQWPPALAKKLPGDQPLYLVRVNESLRAIVQAAEGQQPEVLDIVPQEALDFVAQAAAKNGA
jgi:hypothetical protein